MRTNVQILDIGGKTTDARTHERTDVTVEIVIYMSLYVTLYVLDEAPYSNILHSSNSHL